MGTMRVPIQPTILPLQVGDRVRVLGNSMKARRYTHGGELSSEKFQSGQSAFISALFQDGSKYVYIVPYASQIGMHPYNLISVAELELINGLPVPEGKNDIVDVNTLLKDI